MIIRTSENPDAAEFEAMLLDADADDRVGTILILACDENGFVPENVDAALRRMSKPVIGGIFPEIMHHHQKWSRGFIIAGIAETVPVHRIPDLSDTNVDYEEIIEKTVDPSGVHTMLTFVDGLSSRITALIDSLFNIFGLEFNYIGGGAGSLSFQPKPCLFTNDGLVEDSAVLAMLPNKSGVGVSHGWMDVDGPFRVTESDRNVIQTLDWKPAFEVYRQVVEDHSGQIFTDENFFELAKGYPFGIQKLGSEKIVRDPICIGDNGSLVCVGEVPRESYVNILSGNTDSLVSAAASALELSEQSYEGSAENRTILFVDCISRVLFLQDDFSRELEAVHQEHLPMIGALSLGEIANSGKDYLEFYNKTSVVALLED